MKIAQLIVPEWNRDRAPHRAMLSDVEARILERWSLCTKAYAIRLDGTTRPVVIFSIPMDRADVVHLRELAQGTCRRWLLDFVEIVTPVGDWELVK